MILQRVTPVTHSVGNCLKRVIVIVASVIVFQNPMSQKNMIGELLSALLAAAICIFLAVCHHTMSKLVLPLHDFTDVTNM